MITQNKGEWSELYVFLKLLGDGVLYAADADLNKIEDLYYPLIEILRKEDEQVKHYVKDSPNIQVKDDDGNIVLKLPMSEFESKAKLLLEAIKKYDSTFAVPEIEKFMNIIKCTKVKADSVDKSDITLILHDCKTLRDEQFGFSIKSKLGHASTLLNPGKTNNFIYEIKGNLTEQNIKEINSIDTSSKIKDRLQKINEAGCSIKFVKIESDNFNANLQMIDSQFPLIASEYLYQRYTGTESTIKDITEKVKSANPCNFNKDLPQNLYAHKIKSFLTAVALGMTPAKTWDGKFQATGGYIVVREDGEILCYHIYNHNEFQDYLFNNTRIETPSTSRYDFGYIYQKDGENYIKLNLQIRFI